MDDAKDKENGLVVVIDDDEAARVSVGQMLRLRGWETEIFASAVPALRWPRLSQAACIVTDVKMPCMDGEQFLAELKRRGEGPPVIMITGHGDVAMAVRCLKAGAYDFVEKPFEDEVLLTSVARAAEKTALRRESRELRRRLNMISPKEEGRFGMVGKSRAMQDVYDQIEVLARSTAPVLITGETGAGKELVARAIHESSARSSGPFIPVNAGALPETMMESELFGHAKGAFTGAETDRDGKIVSASGGTLLLDEVESISPRAQVQLLRVLEDGVVFPLGKDKPRKTDARLICATKQDLKETMEAGHLREDFYHRIVVLTIDVPPLRQRMDDLTLLVSHFVKSVSDRYGVPVPRIPEETLSAMLRHKWPGNVRELRNAVERMVFTASEGKAGPFRADEEAEGLRLISLPATSGPLREEMERTERSVIEAALSENRGEVGATSVALGISRRALYERMKKYGLHKEDFRKEDP